MGKNSAWVYPLEHPYVKQNYPEIYRVWGKDKLPPAKPKDMTGYEYAKHVAEQLQLKVHGKKNTAQRNI